MPRYIDTVPVPEAPLDKKIIALSFGRNGTFGLHKAFNILGYKAYHFAECFYNGVPHVRIVTEALQAKYFGEGEPFGREEFDKWLKDYDALTDVPTFFIRELVAAYPDAKFILTVREPDAWLRSIHKSFLPLQKAQNTFPLWHMRCIEPFTYRFFKMTDLLCRIMWRDIPVYEGPEADKRLLATYADHNDQAMKAVPPGKLLVVKLEDGLGWEQICPFLGHKIPDVPYPRGNDPNEFAKLTESFMLKNWRKTFTTYALVLLLVLCAIIWYLTYCK